MSTVTAQRIAGVRLPPETALGPRASSWADVLETTVALMPTPLDAQPSAYVQAAWREREYGSLPAAAVSCAVAGADIFMRIRWAALNPRPAITDNDVYADACALLFPLDGVAANLRTMGDAARPVQAWHWRAGTALPFVVNATGLGSTSRQATHNLSVVAEWADGEWAAVLRRPLTDGGVPLRPGATVPIGVAVWTGALQERAGLKSHSADWIPLELPQ